MRGRPPGRRSELALKDFNPRPHAGATFSAVIPGITSQSFQSTPPCGGDFPQTCISGVHCFISIHAPMRGRLDAVLGEDNLIHISIHAPMRGRPWHSLPQCVRIYFNPRPHAGATGPATIGAPMSQNFNPRPHAGATPSRLCSLPAGLYFNPRPHAGATTGTTRAFWMGCISIHAPMRGRLLKHLLLTTSHHKFQSTPPCGGDAHLPQPVLCFVLFQSTPPCGGDPNRGDR